MFFQKKLYEKWLTVRYEILIVLWNTDLLISLISIDIAVALVQLRFLFLLTLICRRFDFNIEDRMTQTFVRMLFFWRISGKLRHNKLIKYLCHHQCQTLATVVADNGIVCICHIFIRRKRRECEKFKIM